MKCNVNVKVERGIEEEKVFGKQHICKPVLVRQKRNGEYGVLIRSYDTSIHLIDKYIMHSKNEYFENEYEFIKELNEDEFKIEINVKE